MKENVLIFMRGLAMGVADAVPGVSGGTIALITGIYEKLIYSIKSFDMEAIKLVRRLQLKEFWKHINGTFLLFLLLGIATSLISLAHLITYLLKVHPIQVWSFFFGLIVISSLMILKEIKRWNFQILLSLLVGIVAAYLITEITPAKTPNQSWFIFISGAIAICAMILPGISGAFILLLLGKYEFIYNALKTMNIAVISVFVIGCIVGILSFSKVLSWLLKNFYHLAIALLSGFMIGSLNKIWPWKIVTLYKENASGEQIPLAEKNVLPANFYQITGNEPYVLQAILFIALGILVVVIIEKISRRT